MFDLITGQARHLPRHPALPIIISAGTQVLVGTAVLAIPYLLVTERLPEIPTMMAFVAAAPTPPPPPPPPAPAPKASPRQPTKAAAPTGMVAPLEAPATVEPEPVPLGGDEEEGVPGGVEGGVPGGVVGGIVGGIPDVPPPPPPPPAPPRGPVRIGGALQAPALIHRVEPRYPDIARAASYEGIVILEATVNERGEVTDVRVLRSGGLGGVLDREAVTALRQWQYSPLLLNGRPVEFVLTVTFSFHVNRK